MPQRYGKGFPFYPAYCFHLSSTYNTWVRLGAADVHALEARHGFEGQNVFFYLNHPIRYVRLVGAIVAFDVLPSRFIFAIDDYSGATIDVTCERPKATENILPANGPLSHVPDQSIGGMSTKGQTPTGKEVDFTGIDVGTIVKIKGSISTFRDERQILLERLWTVSCTNEEVTAWAETHDFLTSILAKPWVLKESEIGRAQRVSKSKKLLEKPGQHTKRLNRDLKQPGLDGVAPKSMKKDADDYEREKDDEARQRMRVSDRTEREQVYRTRLRHNAREEVESSLGPKTERPNVCQSESSDKALRVTNEREHHRTVCEQEEQEKQETYCRKTERSQRKREADKRERQRIFAQGQREKANAQ